MATSQSELPSASDTWQWPESLDALVAAPAFHKKLFENERVRVLHTLIPVGAFVPLHTHRCPGVAHLLSWSHFIRRDQEGNVMFDSRQAGSPPRVPFTQWLDPLPPHTVENLGQSEISIYIVELKDAATAPAR